MLDPNMENIETATLGGGCFWCLEAVFDELQGVVDVVSGYSGGMDPNPDYESVCSGTTGHAEVVQLKFDKDQVSYREILDVFFSIHDPTTLNRQGADIGSQYRSVILYHDEEQKDTANQVIQEINSSQIWDSPLVTQLLQFERFHPAESYHQEYYKKNPYQGYCQVVIAPKLSKFRNKFKSRVKG